MVPGEEISARKALEISNYTSKQLEDGEKKVKWSATIVMEDT